MKKNVLIALFADQCGLDSRLPFKPNMFIVIPVGLYPVLGQHHFTVRAGIKCGDEPKSIFTPFKSFCNRDFRGCDTEGANNYYFLIYYKACSILCCCFVN